MKHRLTSFAYLFPVMELLFAVVIVVAPALLFFFRLKQVAHGSEIVSLKSGDFVMTIRSDRLLWVAFERTGWSAERLVTILNAPAKFVEVFVSFLVAQKAYWYPASLLPGTWHALVYPIYALPAWLYVGLGLDAMIGRRRVHKWDMGLSLFLALTTAALFCGFRFGMPAAEREGQERLNWFIEGFAIWAVLFAIPFAAWMRQKKRTTSVGNEVVSS